MFAFGVGLGLSGPPGPDSKGTKGCREPPGGWCFSKFLIKSLTVPPCCFQCPTTSGDLPQGRWGLQPWAPKQQTAPPSREPFRLSSAPGKAKKTEGQAPAGQVLCRSHLTPLLRTWASGQSPARVVERRLPAGAAQGSAQEGERNHEAAVLTGNNSHRSQSIAPDSLTLGQGV